MDESRVLKLHELVDELLKLSGRSQAGVWACEREALHERVRRAAEEGHLRVRHPESLLTENFDEWPQPSRAALVCTVTDINEWLSMDGCPIRLAAKPDAAEEVDHDSYDDTAHLALPLRAKDMLGIGAQFVRGLLLGDSDELKQIYGCTPEEATLSLACVELAELAVWDLEALVDATTVGGTEDERLAWGEESRQKIARRISLAMKAENTPDVMAPAAGVLLLRRAGFHIFHELVDAVALVALSGNSSDQAYRELVGLKAPDAVSNEPNPPKHRRQCADTSEPHSHDGLQKRWTDEKKAEVQAYRDQHGVKKAAEKFGVSDTIIKRHTVSNRVKRQVQSTKEHNPAIGILTHKIKG
jgi:hypothetical protein